MTIVTNTAAAVVTPEKANSNLRRRKLGVLLTDPAIHNHDSDYDDHSSSRHRFSDASFTTTTTTTSADNPVVYYSNPNSATSSPYNPMSPWSQPSPYAKSPWIHQLVASSLPDGDDGDTAANSYGLIGSLYREEGHVYSLAAAAGLLYTGSDSKNVRVWKNLQEFSGFKSSSGFVKAIVVHANRIFTGHQDGKIRVWKLMGDTRNTHKRVGSLPTTRDLLVKSMNPKNYVEVRRHRNVPWVKHYDAVSCLSVDADRGLLYSGSWDKTLKVWRISDSKCLESVAAHDDAVNSLAVGFDGLVFTGSADGTVKAWRRELVGRSTRHVLVDTMLRGDHALTSLAAGGDGGGALYAGSSDGLVSFWERGKHFMSYGGVLRGHKLAVLCLAVGGSLVMSGSADKTICVWRRDGGGLHSCLAVLTGHSGPVKCLAVERDSSSSTSAAVADEDTDEDKRWIAYSGCLDNSVKVWRVSEHAGLNAEDDDEEEEE